MLTKDDLQSIKEIFQTNNKVLATIIKIELAETNKKIESIHKELKKEIQTTNKHVKNASIELKAEIQQSEKRLVQKIDKINYGERIEQLEQRVQTLETIIKTFTSSRL